MGKLLSPFISNIFMDRIEECIEQLGIVPRFWARCVDDIFAIGKRSQFETILNKLNTVHKSVTFTMEVEHNHQLSFLDLIIINNRGKIEFHFYRKPTSTQRTILATS